MTVDLQSWQTIAAGAAIVIVAVYNRWESRKTRKTAEKAVELSTPTGNGFAKKVTEALDRIEKKGDRTEQLLVDHIAAHADADVHNYPRRKRDLKDVNAL